MDSAYRDAFIKENQLMGGLWPMVRFISATLNNAVVVCTTYFGLSVLQQSLVILGSVLCLSRLGFSLCFAQTPDPLCWMQESSSKI